MATLLQAVNEILKRTGEIAGENQEFSNLTNDARQRAIDVAVQVINEGMDELYSTTGLPHPKEQAEDTITLVAGDRDYALASDLVQLRFPLIDKSNNHYIFEFAGGYNRLLIHDPEQDDTGLPHYGVISPVDGQLYLDRAPTSNDAGRVYTYQYDKDLSLSDSADTFPFPDAVFRAMVPAWVQLWKREMRNEFDGDLFNANMGRASRFLMQKHPRTHWSPRA